MSQKQVDKIPENRAQAQFSTNLGYFKNFLDSLESTRDEGLVIVDEDNVFSKAVDESNVLMCVSRVKGQALNHLNINNGDRVELGMNFEQMQEFLKGTSKSSEIQITAPIDDSGAYKAKIEIIDEDITFYAPLVDKDAVPGIPQNDPMSHKNRVVVSGTDIKKAIKHAGKVCGASGSAVEMVTEEGLFAIESDNKVDGSFRKEFHQSGPSDGGGLDNKRTTVGYKFLDKIASILNASDEITIHIEQDNPVRFDADLDDNGDAQIIYIIAPRLDNE